MKTRKNVIKKRTVSISRAGAGAKLDGHCNLHTEVRHRVVSKDYQYPILTLGHDIGEFQ